MRKSIGWMVTCCLGVTSVFASEITEQQFVQLLLRKHKLVENAKLKLEIKQIERDGSKKSYDGIEWKIAGALGERYRKTDKDTENSYVHKKRAHIREAYTEINKTFANTGAKLKLKASRSLPKQLEENYDEQVFNNYDYLSEHQNKLSLNFTVPLLKNRGGILDRKNYDIDMLDVDDEKLVIQQEQNEVVYKHLNWFIDWAYYLEQAKIYRQRIEIATNLIQLATEQRESEKTLLIIKNEIGKAEQLLLNTENKIAAIKKKISASLQDSQITHRTPKITWHKKPALLGSPRDYLKKHSIKLKRIQIEQAINQRHTKAYKNAKLPELNIVLQAEREIIQGNYISYSYQKDTDYEAKIELSYPLFGNYSNKTNLHKALVKKRLLQIKYDDTLRDLLADIEEITTKIKLGKKEIQDLKTQAINMQKEASSERQNYLDGNINARFLLRTQKNWIETKLEHAKVLWDFQKNQLYHGSLSNKLLKHQK